MVDAVVEPATVASFQPQGSPKATFERSQELRWVRECLAVVDEPTKGASDRSSPEDDPLAISEPPGFGQRNLVVFSASVLVAGLATK